MMNRYKITFVLLFLFAILSCKDANAQKYTYQFSEKAEKNISGDVVILPFGNSYPVKVGELSGGKLTMDLENVQSDVSRQIIDDHTTNIVEQTPFSCEDYDDSLPKSEVALAGSFVVLAKDGLMIAELFAVTDKSLKDWFISGGHESPVKSSFYEMMYSDFDVVIQDHCQNYSENGQKIIQNHQMDLDLKKGFNRIEFRIEEVGKSENGDFDIPVKTMVTNKKMDWKNVKWVLNPIEGH
ncbi:hypothetical protein [Moheibacter stercoris]|uniref:Uncharacterized protein n=1 Tax=Moheibacter stercoris TaxID=1628251 RepID=A0ABV2LQN7_9FLAO